MRRDRTQTEQRLLDAVDHIITHSGLDQVGINRVSRQAGITKILIYRYFGGLDGLLQAYYKRRCLSRTDLAVNINDLKEKSIAEIMTIICEVTLREYRRLRQDVQMQQFLKANLMGNDTFINPLIHEREGQLRKLIDSVSDVLNSKTGRSFSAIIISAMSFLTFMSQQKRSMLDIELSTDEGWAQIEEGIRNIYRGATLLLEERQRLADAAEKPS